MVEACDFWWKLLYWSSTREFHFVRLTCVPSLDDLQPDAPFILSLYPVVVFFPLSTVKYLPCNWKQKAQKATTGWFGHSAYWRCFIPLAVFQVKARLSTAALDAQVKTNWWNLFTFTCFCLFLWADNWKYGKLNDNLAADQALCPCGKSCGCRPAALIMGSITLSDLMILFKEGVGRLTWEEEINPA